MDPVSVVGLAASIVQLTSFIGSLLSKSREIHNSATGALDENAELEAITSSLNQLTEDVRGHQRSLEREWTPHLESAPSGKPWKSKEERSKAKEVDLYGKRKKQLDEMCEGCEHVTDKLLTVVKELKGKAPDGRWASLRLALLTVWKEGEVRDLSHRIERYRQQIDTLLLVSISERIQAQQHPTSNDTAEQSLPPSDSWKSAIINNVKMYNWQAKNEQDVAMFSACLSESLELDREQCNKLRILENLRFSDMSDRYERISEAHKKTFEWIFAQPSQDEQESAQAQPSNVSRLHKYRQGDFVNWLRSDENLFWITGKPGSGKSTLVKYLHDEPRLLEHLESWQGGKELFKTGFFFWNSGTVMQMSKMGLLRKILYDALEHSPHLISSHFPNRWKFTELFGSDPRPWSWAELREAFEIFLSDDSKKTFIFFDGLDEFDGDYADLPSWLFSMLSSRQNAKVCVASRPWTVFEDAFGSRPSLRVEDLTEHDIRLFTLETLDSQSNGRFHQLQTVRPTSAQHLITEITEKAAGVFLWVRLVVMSLLEGLQDGDSIADLQARTRSLPPELEELFMRIMKDLKPSYRKEASRMIRIVQTALEVTGIPVTLLAFCFLDNDIHEAMSAEVKTLDSEDLDFRLDTMRRRLSSRSKGLLEASHFHMYGPETSVQFLHRTVRDFVAREDIREYLHAEEEDFDVHQALCACEMLHIKCLDVGRKSTNDAFTTSITLAAWYSEKLPSADDAFKTAVIYELHKTGKRLFPEEQRMASESASPGILELQKSYLWIELALKDILATRYCLIWWAVTEGLVSFVRHELRHHQLIKYTSFNLLKHAIEPYAHDGPQHWNTQIIALLFENGADPNNSNGRKLTPWRLLVHKLSQQSVLSYNDLNMIELFCRNNARPRIHTEGNSRSDILRRVKETDLFTAITPEPQNSSTAPSPKPQKRRLLGRLLGSFSRHS